MKKQFHFNITTAGLLLLAGFIIPLDATEFTLGFEPIAPLVGESGEVVEAEVRATIRQEGLGARAQGWSFSMVAEGLKLVDITDGHCPQFPPSETEICLLDPHYRTTTVSEAGFFLGGFFKSELSTGPAGPCENAVVHALTNSLAVPVVVTLDIADIAVVFFEATMPRATSSGTLRYTSDGCVGSGQPIDTVIVSGELSPFPRTEDLVVELLSSPFELFARGDANGDTVINIADPTSLANWLFGFPASSEPPCLDAADANGDGELNIADPSFIANFEFGIGAATPPPAPGPVCGPGGLILGCESPPEFCAAAGGAG